jgi:chaperone required for assembly of F1-ATPase
LAEASDLENGNISKNELIKELTKYLETDTLLYWDSVGTDLRLKQEENWGPAIRLFSSVMKLPSLKVTDSLFELRQDENLTSSFIKFMNELELYQLAGTRIVLKIFTKIHSPFSTCQSY